METERSLSVFFYCHPPPVLVCLCLRNLVVLQRRQLDCFCLTKTFEAAVLQHGHTPMTNKSIITLICQICKPCQFLTSTNLCLSSLSHSKVGKRRKTVPLLVFVLHCVNRHSLTVISPLEPIANNDHHCHFTSTLQVDMGCTDLRLDLVLVQNTVSL